MRAVRQNSFFRDHEQESAAEFPFSAALASDFSFGGFSIVDPSRQLKNCGNAGAASA